MKRMVISSALAFLLVVISPISLAEPLLVPVGQTIGLQLQDNTVTIAAFDDKLGTEAKHAGLKIGDWIVKVNGQTVHNIQELRAGLDSSGPVASLLVRRGAKELEIPVQLNHTDSGAQLGA